MKKGLKISIIGLGYVGLPLAIEFSKIYNVVGYDINVKRILELNQNKDTNGETSSEPIRNALNKNLKITSDQTEIYNSDIFIVTVPTPISDKKIPDLKYLQSACRIVGKFLKKDNVVMLDWGQ